MLAVRLAKEMESRLNNLAALTHRTKSFYVKQVLVEYLDDMEDVYMGVLVVRIGHCKQIYG